MKLWKEGDILSLINDSRAIQHRLPNFSSTHAEHQISRSFGNLMFQGKTRAALDLFVNSGKGSLLHLDDKSYTSDADPSITVKDIVLSKHPLGQPANAMSATEGDLPKVHPIIFDAIDATRYAKLL